MPTLTMAAPPTEPQIALVRDALSLALNGRREGRGRDIFAPDFRFLGPARELFPVPGSARTTGQLSEVALAVGQMAAQDDRVTVSFDARARCHRTAPVGEPVCARRHRLPNRPEPHCQRARRRRMAARREHGRLTGNRSEGSMQSAQYDLVVVGGAGLPEPHWRR